MNQAFALLATLSLTMILWGLGKKPKKISFSKTNKTDFAEINHETTSLVQSKFKRAKKKSICEQKEDSIINFRVPTSPRERKNLLTELKQSMKEAPEQRIETIKLAGLWNHPSILPLLKLGLKDSDSRVVVEAAEILKRFRGKPQGLDQPEIRPPRNVALMR